MGHPDGREQGRHAAEAHADGPAHHRDECQAGEDADSLLKMIDPRSGATVDIGMAAKARERAAIAEAEAAARLAKYGTEPWQVTNKSQTGLGIMRRERPNNSMCVGEIISLAGKGKEAEAEQAPVAAPTVAEQSL